MNDGFDGWPRDGRRDRRRQGRNDNRRRADHARLFDRFAERLAGLIAGSGARQHRAIGSGRPA